MRFTTILATLLVAGFVAAPVVPASAAASTSKGLVSVAQVMEAIAEALAKPEAAQLLTAYLAGIGESAGILTAERAVCARPIAVDAASILAALNAAAPDKKTWTETPATPIVLASILDRAGCK